MGVGHESQEFGGYSRQELSRIRLMAIRTMLAENYAPFSEDDILQIRKNVLQPSMDSLIKSLGRDGVSSQLAETQKSLEPLRSPSQLTVQFIIQDAFRIINSSLENTNILVQQGKIDHPTAAGNFLILCDLLGES